jgi:hypothetical protein
MKNIFIAMGIVAIHITACSTAHIPVNTPEVNLRVKDERVNEMLLGHCSRICLMESPYKEWFLKNYSEYTVDSARAEKLTPLLKNKTVVVFLGTWCGDSRREVPRLLKILDYCGFPDASLKLVMVDYRDGAYKQSPQREEKGKRIFRVPTIQLYSGKKELGRIIEFPTTKLEEDLLAILDNRTYIPNYEAGHGFLKKVEESSLKSLYADSAVLSNSLKNRLRNSFELNSIGYVLLDQHQKEKSLFVFKLNKDLYPSAVNAWNGLARAYISFGKKDFARAAIEKARALDPTNEETRRLLKVLE